jgi:hypothetical protein
MIYLSRIFCFISSSSGTKSYACLVLNMAKGAMMKYDFYCINGLNLSRFFSQGKSLSYSRIYSHGSDVHCLVYKREPAERSTLQFKIRFNNILSYIFHTISIP